MCDPTTAIIVSAIGTGFSAVNSIQSGKAAAAAAERDAQLFERDAQIREEQAEFEARRINRRNRQAMARSILSTGPVGLGDTSEDLFFDDAEQLTLDEEIVRWGGQMDAEGLRFKALSRRADGAAAKQAGVMGAISATVSGLGKIAGGLADMPGQATGGAPSAAATQSSTALGAAGTNRSSLYREPALVY